MMKTAHESTVANVPWKGVVQHYENRKMRNTSCVTVAVSINHNTFT